MQLLFSDQHLQLHGRSQRHHSELQPRSSIALILTNAREPFMDGAFLKVAVLAFIVFSFFNFRPCGKANRRTKQDQSQTSLSYGLQEGGKPKVKCFAGDVGSVGIALILLFMIGQIIVQTGDITWPIFLLVYGVDGCLTIVHRILLHEKAAIE